MGGSEPTSASGWRRYDRPVPILLLLFCVTGVLGLPVLWISHAFSVSAKVILSIVVTLYTAALVGAVVWICWWAFQRVSQAL